MMEILNDTRERKENLWWKFNNTTDPEELEVIIVEMNALEEKENYCYKKIKEYGVA